MIREVEFCDACNRQIEGSTFDAGKHRLCSFCSFAYSMGNQAGWAESLAAQQSFTLNENFILNMLIHTDEAKLKEIYGQFGVDARKAVLLTLKTAEGEKPQSDQTQQTDGDRPAFLRKVMD